MKVLVVGSGGREHALVWKLKQSRKVQEIFCAPGNGGIAQIAQCAAISPEDITGLMAFVKAQHIDLTIVGPEAPLVAGIVDMFRDNGLIVFGPTREAARLEGSKVFAKEFMRRHAIPTADFQSFNEVQQAKASLAHKKFPLVIKADGLAAGKGVVICHSLEEANQALDDMMINKVFQEAGSQVIIEDCLEGQEASILAMSDGQRFCILESSQDHKRIFDDDQGPNTGGMGAYSPAPLITKKLMTQISMDVIAPTIQGMRQEGRPFQGILYAGVMITKEGPKVLEYNVRFGDPETQAVLPRLMTDLADLCLAAAQGQLGLTQLEWDRRFCACVVMASRGYPGAYEKGKVIRGLEQASQLPQTMVFHAGTVRQGGDFVTAGGRVLAVAGLGENIAKAVENAYNGVQQISFDGCFFRRDIAAKAF